MSVSVLFGIPTGKNLLLSYSFFMPRSEFETIYFSFIKFLGFPKDFRVPWDLERLSFLRSFPEDVSDLWDSLFLIGLPQGSIVDPLLLCEKK